MYTKGTLNSLRSSDIFSFMWCFVR